MASVTLAESAKLSLPKLIAGVIENIKTVDLLFEVLPFNLLEGNATEFNRENALGDVELIGVGGTITAKAAATFTKLSKGLTKIIGDAEVDNMIEMTRSNIQSQTAVQIASKAKSAGRTFRNQLINGDGTGDNMTGLLAAVAAGQTLTPATNGEALSFARLDELMDKVTDKEAMPDFITWNQRTNRSYKALLRALGGASINETIELPSGAKVMGYSGVPIFPNNYVPINQTQGTETAATTVLCGTFDDGTEKHGIAGIVPAKQMGIAVVPVGESETKDEFIWRVKWYCNVVNYSELGLAALPGINN